MGEADPDARPCVCACVCAPFGGRRVCLSKSNDGPLEIKCLIKHCEAQLAVLRGAAGRPQSSPVTHFHGLTRGSGREGH